MVGNTQKDEKAGEMKNKVPIEDGPAMSSANSTASNSTASGGGRWGEQNIADVNVEQAYDDFEE